jgi:hypothetical protein
MQIRKSLKSLWSSFPREATLLCLPLSSNNKAIIARPHKFLYLLHFDSTLVFFSQQSNSSLQSQLLLEGFSAMKIGHPLSLQLIAEGKNFLMN